MARLLNYGCYNFYCYRLSPDSFITINRLQTIVCKFSLFVPYPSHLTVCDYYLHIIVLLSFIPFQYFPLPFSALALFSCTLTRNQQNLTRVKNNLMRAFLEKYLLLVKFWGFGPTSTEVVSVGRTLCFTTG